MNFFIKNRVIFWLLLILVLINLGILVSFLYFNNRSQTPACCPTTTGPENLLHQELRLTPGQQQQVGQINAVYKSTAASLVDEIREYRGIILEELDQERPDTATIRKTAEALARLQFMLQQESIRQYLALKKVCTPEQAHRLSALYHELYGCPMKGTQNQNRHRHGWGKQK